MENGLIFRLEERNPTAVSLAKFDTLRPEAEACETISLNVLWIFSSLEDNLCHKVSDHLIEKVPPSPGVIKHNDAAHDSVAHAAILIFLGTGRPSGAGCA